MRLFEAAQAGSGGKCTGKKKTARISKRRQRWIWEWMVYENDQVLLRCVRNE